MLTYLAAAINYELITDSPSLLLKEGLIGKIPCVVTGQADSYFWRKGELYNNSREVASIVRGILDDTSENFTVAADGGLVIKNVSMSDEGRYYCRISSKESQCHGGLVVYVEAIRAKFALNIASCGNESSCTTYLEPSDIATFICSAKKVSASTKLKWFINGSEEITDYISEETYGNLNEEDFIELSSTVRIRYERPTSLTCQAVDIERRNGLGRFAHIQLQTKVLPTTEEYFPVWTVVVIMILIILCIILMAVLIFMRGKEKEEILQLKETILSRDKTIADQREKISDYKETMQDQNNKVTDLEVRE
ncbi:hypothetical protein BSL78_11432 [Apostichopus japonicus]|uniref:Ig-like domain-containing protein n=1 Tax=Stichopus japonicus TaxID=307972 RepID=A0A2G8KUS2_STIJA|nr:hypothetical protein BSL78_11432 [Apostichopus japonicus]